MRASPGTSPVDASAADPLPDEAAAAPLSAAQVPPKIVPSP